MLAGQGEEKGQAGTRDESANMGQMICWSHAHDKAVKGKNHGDDVPALIA